MSTPRIAPLPVARWQPGLLDQAGTLTQGGIRATNNVYGTLANYPSLFLAWLRLGAHAFRHSTLPPRLREIVILRAAGLSQGRYPCAQHVTIGKACGLSDADIAAVFQGPQAMHWSASSLAQDKRTLFAVDELIAGGAMNDATWSDLTKTLNLHQCMDLVATTGFYRLAAWMLNACRTPLQDDGIEVDLHQCIPAAHPTHDAYQGEVRIQPISPDEWPRDLLAETARWPRFRNRPETRSAGVYSTFANHPALFSAIGALMAHNLDNSSLSAEARELVIVRACAMARGGYPYRQHIRIGREAGLSETVLNAASQLTPQGLTGEAQIIVGLVDSLFETHDIDDNLWAIARSNLSSPQFMDVIMIAGFYGIISMVLNVAGTRLEEGQATLPEEFLAKE